MASTPLYNPVQPSSRTIRFTLCVMLSCGALRLATCMRLLTVMYGYVILVASSLPTAPSTNASRGRTRRRLSTRFFNCSKIVYCRIGFTTSTSAGSTPANSAVGPSSRISASSVPIVEGFFADRLEDRPPPGRASSLD